MIEGYSEADMICALMDHRKWSYFIAGFQYWFTKIALRHIVFFCTEFERGLVAVFELSYAIYR